MDIYHIKNSVVTSEEQRTSQKIQNYKKKIEYAWYKHCYYFIIICFYVLNYKQRKIILKQNLNRNKKKGDIAVALN